MSILLISPILLIALVALIVLGVRAGQKEGDEEMIKSVYVYLVLFATLMMTIGGSVSAFMAVADIVAPAPYYQSFEDFKRYGFEKEYVSENKETQEVKPSEEELKVRYDAMVLAENQKQVDRAKNSLIKSFGWIIIPLAIFIYFQRKLVKSKA